MIMSNRFKSLFPPLLPEQQAPPRRNKKTVTMMSTLQQYPESRGPTPVAVKRQRLKMSTWGSQAALQQASDNLARQRKIKLLQRAKAILVAWEELQKKERDTKYSTLQEKVVLQRELITRQDQMQLITATNKIATSAQRIKKRDITEPPSLTRRQKKCTANGIGPRTPSGETSSLGEHTPSSDAASATPTNTDTAVNYSFKPPQNRILEILGVSQEAFEQLKIEDMWAGLKAHASKELNKADAHIRILKGESSPSVRECMELYDEPIVCDPYTGKSLLLGDRLRGKQLMATSERSHTLRSSKTSASLKSWCANQQLDKQRETLLSGHDGLGWLTGISYEGSSKEPGESPPLEQQQLPTIEEQHHSSPQHRSKSVTILTEPEVIRESSMIWQPLTVGALVETQGVTVREPLKSSMKTTWRPPVTASN